MRIPAPLPPLALLLLAGACTRPPRADLDPVRTLATLEAPAPLPSGDLEAVLTACAWRSHPDLQRARAEQAVARAAIRTAGARPNPSLGFGATKAEGVPQPWTLAFGLTVPLELGGKRQLRIRQAELQAQMAELAVADTAWRLRMGVHAALVDWRQARAAAALADQEETLWAGLQALQNRRFALGEVAAPDRAATDQEAQRARAARIAAQAGLRRSEAALALAAGVNGRALAARLAAEPKPDPGPGPGAVAGPPPRRTDALVDRLDVRRILLAWDQNETSIRQELAQRVPDVQLGPGYSLDQGVRKWTLGLSVELPLLDRRQGPLAEAVARRKVIEAQLRQAEAQALAAADLAEARWAAAREVRRAQAAAVAGAEARRTAARRAFALGSMDRGALLAAELEALQAHGLAVEAEAEEARARLAVEEAFQRPLDPAEPPFPLEARNGAAP